MKMEKQLKSELIFEGRIIKVYKDEIETATGKITTREVVRHHGGVGILALNHDKILLVEQYRYPYACNTLEIPAGKLEPGEDVESCASRELEEETGYSSLKLVPITKIYPTPGYCDELLHICEAKNIFKVDNPAPGDEDENIKVIELDILEAYRKVIDGTIMDAKTVIAIMHAYINYRL